VPDLHAHVGQPFESNTLPYWQIILQTGGQAVLVLGNCQFVTGAGAKVEKPPNWVVGKRVGAGVGADVPVLVLGNCQFVTGAGAKVEKPPGAGAKVEKPPNWVVGKRVGAGVGADVPKDHVFH